MLKLIDSGIYTRDGVRNQPEGRFTISDLRYDLSVGRSYSEYASDRSYANLVGCQD